MSHRIIRVIVEKRPELYQELTAAMLNHAQYQGCYVEQYSEIHEGGQTVAKFMLRKAENHPLTGWETPAESRE